MVTPGAFIAKVRELASQSPDHVYEQSRDPDETVELGNPSFVGSCRYLNLGEDPEDRFAYGCLFGQVMRQLGDPLDRTHEGVGIGMVLQNKLGWNEKSPLVEAANEAQAQQDSGQPWGKVLVTFNRLLGSAPPIV